MNIGKLNKKKITILVLTLLCVISTLGLGVYSFAKYTLGISKKALVIPASFKFGSDYLKDTNPSYNIYHWSDGISIELYNSIDSNKSEIDIPYTVTVINGTSNVISGVITTVEDTDTLTVTPINTNLPMTVNVSSSTYDYTLSATFNFIATGNKPYYSIINYDSYCELTINTSDDNINSLSVNWNSNYAPDNTNPLMETWIGTTGTLSLFPNTEYTFIFFKNINISCSNITSTIIQNNLITLP